MRLLFAGGGTGGHINPAIAIAEAMCEKHKSAEIAFVGRRGGDENKAVTNHSYKLYTLEIRGLSRKISLEAIKSAYLAIKSLSEAKKIIREFSPDAIIATGGYVCWPIARCGIKMGIPTLLHESNIYPGLVTRMLADKCTKLLLNSEESLTYIKGTPHFVEVGNPLRSGFFKESKQEARSRLGINAGEIFIASFGGSLGAQILNEAIIGVMKKKNHSSRKIRHLHSSGKRYYEDIKRDFPELTSDKRSPFVIKEYIDNMPTVLAAADIVISRAGAMTISEIARVGAAAILIPSPNVADDHQMKNALELEAKGAAVVINENDLTHELLYSRISELIEKRALRESLSKNVKSFYKEDSAAKICSEIEKAIQENK